MKTKRTPQVGDEMYYEVDGEKFYFKVIDCRGDLIDIKWESNKGWNTKRLNWIYNDFKFAPEKKIIDFKDLLKSRSKNIC